MPRQYSLPAFLKEIVSPDAYEKWLELKARSQSKRDKRRGQNGATRAAYKMAIHAAVLASNGRDSYTGEPLNWSLIGTYDNAESESGRHTYKAQFALLPTIDHAAPGGGPEFAICGWRTNDAKNDLHLKEFVALCEKVVSHAKSRGSDV